MDQFKKGDEMWWFVVNYRDSASKNLLPDSIDLVHDLVTEDSSGPFIKGDFGFKPHESIWGKSRQEAWDRLKAHIEKWGKLD